jgi:hypothetical protein
MYYTLNLSIGQVEPWPFGSEINFSKDQQKTESYATEKKHLFFATKFSSSKLNIWHLLPYK